MYSLFRAGSFGFPLSTALALAFLSSVAPIHAQAPVAPVAPPPPPDAPGTVSVQVGWLDVKGVNQANPAGQTSVKVTYKANGAETTALIPVEADTFLWKEGAAVQGHGKALLLRDDRYSEGLIQLDLSEIPKDADIETASLQFKVGGVQNKQQAGTFTCYRVLTPWTEEATWAKPQPESPDWKGLQSGRDFETQAFASVDVPSLDDKQKGGQVVEIPGFEKVLKEWVSGASPNNGFLLVLKGKALQLSIPARETLDQTSLISLGGEKNGKAFLVPNIPLLNRILLKPGDLLSAQLSVNLNKLASKTVQGSTAELKVYEASDANAAPGKLLGSFPVKSFPETGELDLCDLAPSLKNLIASPDSKAGFLLTVEGDGGKPPEIEIRGSSDRKLAPSTKVVLHDYPAAQLYDDRPIRPQAGVYARVVDGHLNYRGKRLRLWGVVGFPHVDRLVKMGFNAQRVWEPASQNTKQGEGVYSDESAKKGEFVPYQKGDGSRLDKADEHMADLKAHGFFVMYSGLTGTMPFDPLMVDDSFVAGGADWAQWKEAMGMKKAGSPLHYIFVDDRLQKIKKTHAKNLLTHVNLYTGKAYGEEEHIAIYEVWNENGFVEKVLGGELAMWPPYFKGEMQKRWNQWLVDRYKDDDGLKKAWGSLKEGESLSGGTVLPAPDFAARSDYPEKRGGDFVEFMIDLENNFNQDFRSYCRSLFPSGVGVNVAPFSFDTFYRPNLQWAYTQSLGDVHLQGMYFWDLKSTLDKPPGAYVIDSFTPNNMPVVLYETNAGRPGPYRSEYPIKLAALASYQDWDGVFWHYWSPTDNPHDVAYLTGTLEPPEVSHYWAAVQHQIDPVMDTAMALGGRIFLGNRIPAAKNPDVFQIGKKALFSYSAFRGIGVADATFSKGSRLLYAPKDDSDITLNGKPVPPAGRIQQAIASGEYVMWDWPNGRLIIDAPTVKAYVGKVNGDFRFSDGVTLGDVSTPWICFTMVSADGKPFTGPDATKRILMDGVFDAKNTGFDFDYNVQGGPLDQAKAVHNHGHEPVLVDKVEYKVWFPNQMQGTLKNYDFALREAGSTDIEQKNEVEQHGPTPYMDLLEISNWGAPASLPIAQATAIAKQDYSRGAQPLTLAGSADAGLSSGALFPIPGLDWSVDYPTASKTLENSTLIYTSLSKLDTSSTPDKTVTLTGAQLPTLWNGLADIVIGFNQGKMNKVEVTFQQPPPVQEVITDFTKVLGDPAEKKLDAQYGTTEIHWPAKASFPDVFVTESQGQMKIIYQPAGK
jgi:hypothetical protein